MVPAEGPDAVDSVWLPVPSSMPSDAVVPLWPCPSNQRLPVPVVVTRPPWHRQWLVASSVTPPVLVDSTAPAATLTVPSAATVMGWLLKSDVPAKLTPPEPCV